ncbi:MAG: Rieske (2Fe-2S) protein [Candidatus Methanoperedens sp.]|nr:Rieske (2Fe-2S) protein [Candidatus Methanoperedens sp.]MCZ7395578.1 Rieske (2Fe-2S) protein [Candidatus Methanoperedens sp.]
MNDKITITLTRRRLTEILIGLVALFLTSGVVAAILKYLWPKTAPVSEASEVRIAAVDDVPTGSAKNFVFNGKAALLLHMPAGWRAFGAVCTHLGCIALWKSDENDILCPCHLGRYDPNTGAVISGPPPSPLPAIDIAVREGAVYALNWKDPNYVKSISFYAGAA